MPIFLRICGSSREKTFRDLMVQWKRICTLFHIFIFTFSLNVFSSPPPGPARDAFDLAAPVAALQDHQRKALRRRGILESHEYSPRGRSQPGPGSAQGTCPHPLMRTEGRLGVPTFFLPIFELFLYHCLHTHVKFSRSTVTQ